MFAHEDAPRTVNPAPPGLTDWYEADQLPVRSGVYEVRMCNPACGEPEHRRFQYFDGLNWYMGGDTPNGALQQFQAYGSRAPIAYQWRGLTERAT